MKLTLSRPVSALVGALVLTGTLAACGSSGPSSSPASPSPTAHSSTASSTPAGGTSSAGSATSSGSPAAAHPVITIKNYKYQVPKSVKPGATVTVKNTDSVTHTVTDNVTSGFSVQIKAGSTATFTAPSKPGSYKFHCTIHPYMHGTLVVS